MRPALLAGADSRPVVTVAQLRLLVIVEEALRFATFGDVASRTSAVATRLE
jgi:hypothetical protein